MIKLGKPVHIFPDLPVGCVENMRAVLVHLNIQKELMEDYAQLDKYKAVEEN